MTKSELLKKANELPMKPGVYMMKDVNGTVIYVGKAKIRKKLGRWSHALTASML